MLIGVLFATGTYSMLHRSLTRIIVGVGLHRQRRQPAAHRRRQPARACRRSSASSPGPTDPIPQALVLTAIVIGFALQAFLLALAWRSWTLDGNDDVEDDIEDRRLAAERRREIRSRRGGPPRRARAAAERRRRPAARSGRAHAVPAGRSADEPPRPAPDRDPAARRCDRAAVRCAGRACSGRSASSRSSPRSASSIALLVHADRSGPAVARIGGWSPSIGISYVIDRFAGIMLVIAHADAAGGARVRDRRAARATPSSPIFHPVYLVLAAGVGAAFSTGDLFHLFVSFEILLMASYVLLTLDGDEAQVRAGTTYVVINTIESVVLLVAVGLVYAVDRHAQHGRAAGTAGRARPGSAHRAAAAAADRVRAEGGGVPAVLLAARLVPDGAQPGHRGLRRAAHQGRRVRDRAHPDAAVPRRRSSTLLLWVAGLTMIVGVLGAIAQNDIKRILSFHIVSQIGYMVLGIAIGGPAAIAATIFFLVHQIPIKTSLFLVEGMIEHASGTSRLDRLERAGPPLGLPRRAVPAAGAEPVRASRRSPGSSPSSGCVTAGLDAGAGRARRGGDRRQPADAGVDDEDLAVGVLGRAGARCAPASVGAAAACRAPTLRWPRADDRRPRSASSPSASPSPSSPGRSTRCASVPPSTSSTPGRYAAAVFG